MNIILRYHGHSVVLSAISEYFDMKLDSNLGTALKEILIDNVDNDATQRAIDYCYTGEIGMFLFHHIKFNLFQCVIRQC